MSTGFGVELNGDKKVEWVRLSEEASLLSSMAYSMFSVLRGSWPPAIIRMAEESFRSCCERDANDSIANETFFFRS